ncbi:MAG: M48 family peptidase [Terriglobales bacterium]
MTSNLVLIFQEEYRVVRPRAPMPEVVVRFYPFANINNTIRLREGRLYVRLSDLLEGAPEAVLRGIAHILLAKLYRKPVDRAHAQRYRRHITSRAVLAKAEQLRSLRGRKRIESARGKVYDLDAIFDALNARFFFGLLARPQMTWSREDARNSLGHYDPAHNAIVVSRVFDSPRVPRYAIEYLVYHEMLHLKHPVKVRNGRRCVHGPAFQAEEKLFPHLEEAKAFLKRGL